MFLFLLSRFHRHLSVHSAKTSPAETAFNVAAAAPSRRTGLLVSHSMVWTLAMVSFGLICNADGHAQAPATMTSPTPGSVLSGSSVTFSWTAGTGVTGYWLELGTTGGGTTNVYSSGALSGSSVTVNTLPTNGVTLYATLFSKINGAWVPESYTFTEAGTYTLAALASPAAGSKLSGSTATFTWSPGAGPTMYTLYLGTTGPGSHDVYNSGSLSGTSVTASGIPTNGGQLFGTLFSSISGKWLPVHFTMVEAGTAMPAALTSPAPGSTLGGSSVTFNWNAGSGVTAYWLYLGNTGPNSNNLLNSGSKTGTSLTVNGLPANGVTLYATLYSEIDGAWKPASYTYTESGSYTLAAMTSPTPGSKLTGSSATFVWSASAGGTGYWLYLGSTGAGSSNLYSSGTLPGTSATVNGLPTNGETIYATLFTRIDGAWKPVSYKYTTANTGGPLKITTTSCPGGTQGAAYAGCTINVTGGTPPYVFTLDSSGNYPPLPEGLALNKSTGAITSAQIGGQGAYMPLVVVTDAASAKATKQIAFAINGSNAFLASIFPSNSIFHHRVDAATSSLPVDASPAAPIYSGYQPATIKPFFGNTSGAPFPNGIPAFEVPYNQPNVSVATTVYQSYFTSGPIPANAPVEGTSATDGDRHVLIYREAGGGNPPALYEMWQGIYEGGPWTDSSNALWPDVSGNALTPQGNGTSDAAGLPVAPLLANADEVIGTGTPSAPKGAIQHPIRITVNHLLNYWVWPGTETAGVGSCTDSSGKAIPTGNLISQSSPPKTCSMTGPAGEIYRLKASVPTPSCAATSPQAAILITAFRNYGIILSDNGISGGLIGTPDARWNDNDLECITSLTLGDFEPVNVSSLMVAGSGSGATTK